MKTGDVKLFLLKQYFVFLGNSFEYFFLKKRKTVDANHNLSVVSINYSAAYVINPQEKRKSRVTGCRQV